MRRFEEALSGWTESRLTQEEAARMLGVCARSFRRYVDRYHEDGIDGLIDKRMSQASSLRAPVDEVVRLETLYKESYDGWSVAHFHERYRERHGGGRSYTWTKNRLQAAGLVSKGRSKGRHRKRRERAPVAGLLLHQDGSTHRWVEDGTWDLIATLDDATSEVYSGFFVDEEDTWSSLRGVRETVEGRGLFGSLWTDRGSHYWHTPKAGGAVDKSNPTRFGRAMGELGIEMIPSYSPQARGRSERHFGTMQGRLPNELAAEGVRTMDEANRYLREVFRPAWNKRFAVPAAQSGDAFVPLLGVDLDDILCLKEERKVGNDNCVRYKNLQLQIPPGPHGRHYVRRKVRACTSIRTGACRCSTGRGAWGATKPTARRRPPRERRRAGSFGHPWGRRPQTPEVQGHQREAGGGGPAWRRRRPWLAPVSRPIRFRGPRRAS